jgi:hypothetical protein
LTGRVSYLSGWSEHEIFRAAVVSATVRYGMKLAKYRRAHQPARWCSRSSRQLMSLIGSSWIGDGMHAFEHTHPIDRLMAPTCGRF